VAIHRATEACEQGHILVNGQKIKWSDKTAEGAGTIQTPLVSGLGNRDLNATWRASCIDDEAQILSFQIHQVGLDVVKEDSGFTISFKQQDQPEVLRLLGEPIDVSNTQGLADQWTHPDRPQRLTLIPIVHAAGKSSLDDELLQLEALKAQAYDLERRVREKKYRMHELLREDFRAFCSNIKKCDSLKCVFRTTMHKLPEYAHIISLHFQHHRPSPQVPVSSENEPWLNRIHKQGDDAILYGGTEASAHGLESSPSPIGHDAVDEDDPPPSDHDEKTPTQLNHTVYTSPSPSSSRSIQSSPTSAPHHNVSYVSTPPNRMSTAPQFGDHYHFHHHLFRHIILAVLLLLFLGGITFRALRHLRLCCASPRCRASCSSAREERRNRRAYRRAARQHAWRNWWNRYRRPECTTDYEEKRTLVLEQEGVLEGAMQDEMRGLRVAQEIVGEMVRAEEGRSRLYQQANMPQHSRSHSPTVAELGEAMSSSSSSPSAVPQIFRNVVSLARYPRRTSSASSRSGSGIPPPRYEEELEGDIDVVDGFNYSPTYGMGSGLTHLHTLEDGYAEEYGDDATPDSSVVDCSPRMSFDTGRTRL